MTSNTFEHLVHLSFLLTLSPNRDSSYWYLVLQLGQLTITAHPLDHDTPHVRVPPQGRVRRP